MTYLEWLNELAPEVSENIRITLLENRDISPWGSYTSGQDIELAEADLYMYMTRVPEFKEGSLSIKYDLSSLKQAANDIYKLYGDARYNSGEPLIRSVNL